MSTRARFLLLFVAGVIACLLGWFFDPSRFYFSWLVAFAWLASLSSGALILVAIGHASRARWFTAVRRIAEIPMALVPLLLLLVIPVCLGIGHLYGWAGGLEGSTETQREWIEHKRGWLNPSFFTVRTAIYLLIWSGFAWRLTTLSFEQDANPDTGQQVKMQRISAGSLPLMAFAITFASFDWLMSLDTEWFSTIFGVYFFAGGFLAALAAAGLLSHSLHSRGLLPPEVASPHLISLGKLLLTAVIFWAYIAFVQVLIIWIANEPGEVPFFQRRSQNGWGAVTFVLGLVHFVIPFLLLLSRDLKKSFRSIAWFSSWLLAAHWMDMYWLVMPIHSPGGPTLHWLDLSAMAVMLGASGLYTTWRFAGRPLVASGDPYLPDAYRYRGS